MCHLDPYTLRHDCYYEELHVDSDLLIFTSVEYTSRILTFLIGTGSPPLVFGKCNF